MVSLGGSQWGCCWVSTTWREKEKRSTRLRTVTTRNNQNLFLSSWVWANFHIPNSVTEEVTKSLGEGAWNYDSPSSSRKGTHHLLKELYIWKRRTCKHFEDFRHRTRTDTHALRPKAPSAGSHYGVSRPWRGHEEKTWQARPSRIRDPPGWPRPLPYPISSLLFLLLFLFALLRILVLPAESSPAPLSLNKDQLKS